MAHTGVQPKEIRKSLDSAPRQIWGSMDTPALAAPHTTCSTVCRQQPAVATLRFDGNVAHRRSTRAKEDVLRSQPVPLCDPRCLLCPLPRAMQGATAQALKRGGVALGLEAQSRFMLVDG
jgi:hypothetical protein